MKVKEIINEALPDGTLKQYADYEQSPDSPENLKYALQDAAAQEWMKMKESPKAYFGYRGEDASRYAGKIREILAQVDDKTLDLMSKSPALLRAIEDNYDAESDEAYIPLDAALEVLTKVENRMPQSPPSEERAGYDASRPGSDDAAAYDTPPLGR